MIFLEGFLSSRSSHVLTSCQMHSDRTLVHPYGMCALTSQQRYENAPFDNKHAFLNTLLTFINLFSVLIFLLENPQHSTQKNQKFYQSIIILPMGVSSQDVQDVHISGRQSLESKAFNGIDLKNFLQTGTQRPKCFSLLASVKSSVHQIRCKYKNYNVYQEGTLEKKNSYQMKAMKI